jgi:predicted ester cyclase
MFRKLRFQMIDDKRKCSGGHLIENGSKREEIGAGVDPLARTFHRPLASLVSLNSLLQQDSKICPNSEFSTGELMVTRDKALNLAKLWVAAWNAHDLDLIMMHYDDAVELTSPVAAQLLGSSDGKVVGKPNLRAYFQRGLEAYPELHFHLEDVLWGMNSVVLYYTNQRRTHTAEFMELSAYGKVIRVVANYGG